MKPRLSHFGVTCFGTDCDEWKQEYLGSITSRLLGKAGPFPFFEIFRGGAKAGPERAAEIEPTEYCGCDELKNRNILITSSKTGIS